MSLAAGNVFMGHRATRADLEEDHRTCRVCLDGTPTREHIPPRSAFNDCDRFYGYYYRNTVSRVEGVRSFPARGGYVANSLCGYCNSGVCAKYAREYVKLAKQMAEQGPPSAGDLKGYFLDGINFLYVMKQIAAMILSVNGAGMAKCQPELRKFIADPTARTFMPLTVHLFYVPDLPDGGTITGFHGRVNPLSGHQPYAFIGGEISGYPVGIVYSSEMGSELAGQGLLDITHWSLADDRRAREPKHLTMRSLLTATDTFVGIHCGRNGRRQVEFTNGY